jgi:hypothetical protein
MSNPKPKCKFTSKQASEAGKKSKRKPFDVELAELLDKYLNEFDDKNGKIKRKKALIKAAFVEWCKGNSRPMQYLMDRSFKRPMQQIEQETITSTTQPITIEFVDSTEQLDVNK